MTAVSVEPHNGFTAHVEIVEQAGHSCWVAATVVDVAPVVVPDRSDVWVSFTDLL